MQLHAGKFIVRISEFINFRTFRERVFIVGLLCSTFTKGCSKANNSGAVRCLRRSGRVSPNPVPSVKVIMHALLRRCRAFTLRRHGKRNSLT